MTFGNGRDWIPAEFNAKTDILMVEANYPNKGQDKKMVSYLKEKYPYKYEIVRYNDIMDREGKFANTSLYRWVLMDASTQIQTGSMANPTVPAMDFYFYDRMKDKKYPTTTKGSYNKIVTFKPTINTIIKDSK
jgi:hypothetical protein